MTEFIELRVEKFSLRGHTGKSRKPTGLRDATAWQARGLTAPLHERFFIVGLSPHPRRPECIFAGELDRAPAHRGSALRFASPRQLLENVYDRDPARRDPRLAGLFLEPDPEISRNISEGRARRPEFSHASA